MEFHLKKVRGERVEVRMYPKYVKDMNIVYEALNIKVEGEEADEVEVKSI